MQHCEKNKKAIFNVQKLPFFKPKSKCENIKIKREDAPLKGHIAPSTENSSRDG
jgi:hypothetical protein